MFCAFVYFGRFRVSYDDSPNELKMTPSTKTLLAFLALQAHRLYARDVLVDLYWGERAEEQARLSEHGVMASTPHIVHGEGIPLSFCRYDTAWGSRFQLGKHSLD